MNHALMLQKYNRLGKSMSDNLKLLKETSSKLRRPLLLVPVAVSRIRLPAPVAGGRGALGGVPPREGGGGGWKVLVRLHGAAARGGDDVGDGGLKFVPKLQEVRDK